MSELILKAIDHIDEQAEKENAPLIKAIAQYIIDKCLDIEGNAEKVLDEKLTLKKCVSHVTAEARKLASNGCAVVEDSFVWKWVREFYGFEALQSNAKPEREAQREEPVSLLDFM
jgi:hypothetical protein